MAGGRPYTSLNPRLRSPIVLFVISFLLISLIFYVISLLSPPPLSTNTVVQFTSLNPNADYSFVSSLEKFLSKSRTTRQGDDTVSSVVQEDVRRLDDLIWRRENERIYRDLFYPAAGEGNLGIRVYVYEMPDKFTYDLLWLFQNTYKETDNLTSNGSPVHRLIEQVFVY